MATQANVASKRTTMPGKFVWFEHVSRDSKKAQAFYGEVLGWRVLPWGDSGYDMIATGDAMDFMIGGYDSLRDGSQRAHWLSYVSVEDVDTAARAVAAQGGSILEAPHDLPEVGRMARIADPQGAVLSLFRNNAGDPPDFLASEPPPQGCFFWNELHTTSVSGALSFYEKVVGFTHQTMDMGPAGTYHVLSRDGVDRAGVSDHTPGGFVHWLPYVAVDDPNATVTLAKNSVERFTLVLRTFQVWAASLCCRTQPARFSR